MPHCYKYLRLLILLLSSCFIAALAKANHSDTTNPYFEINRLMETLETANHISFDISYYYENYDSIGFVRDTSYGQYKINGQQFYARLDSALIIQNAFYNLEINEFDSSLVIGRPKLLLPAIMQNDMMNEDLQSVYLSHIVSADSLQYRILNFVLNENAPYKAYSLTFDTSTYFIAAVCYQLRHYSIYDTLPSQNIYYTQIKMVMKNYQLNGFTDAVFDMRDYLNTVNESFAATPAYEKFTIINQVMNH